MKSIAPSLITALLLTMWVSFPVQGEPQINTEKKTNSLPALEQNDRRSPTEQPTVDGSAIDLSQPFFDRMPYWLFVLMVLSLISLSSFAGFRLGCWRGKVRQAPDHPVNTKVGATLGLLAFVLALTFNMAVSRDDTRRQLVLDEANAIAMTYRRANLLPDGRGLEVRNWLREYTDIRLTAASDPSTVGIAFSKTEVLLDQLWKLAETTAENDATSWRTAWYIESLSQVTDLNMRRVVAGLYGRVPTTVWSLLFVTTAFSMLAMGYQAGVAGGLRLFPMAMLVLAFTTIIALIADYDRPQDGLLKVKQTPLIAVQKSMHRDLLSSESVTQNKKETVTSNERPETKLIEVCVNEREISRQTKCALCDIFSGLSGG